MSHLNFSPFGKDDAAPIRPVRQPPVIFDHNRRKHRRGSRSSFARLRRSISKKHRTLSGISLGKSRDLISESQLINRPFDLHEKFRDGIRILSFNIQCLLAHMHELIHVLQIHQPHIVFLQET